MKANREGKDYISETEWCDLAFLEGLPVVIILRIYTPEAKVEAGRPDRKMLQ